MLIVCTQDQTIINFTRSSGSGAEDWGATVVLPAGKQDAATVALQRTLAGVGVNEDLCLSAHGNNVEIGDADPQGWGWRFADIAALLGSSLPRGYSGRILIHACAVSMTSFAVNLAVALQRQQQLWGVWIYGYQKAVPSNAPYPEPAAMDKSLELYAHQVGHVPDASGSKPHRIYPYNVMTRHGHVVQVPPGFDPRELTVLLASLLEEPSAIASGPTGGNELGYTFD